MQTYPLAENETLPHIWFEAGFFFRLCESGGKDRTGILNGTEDLQPEKRKREKEEKREGGGGKEGRKKQVRSSESWKMKGKRAERVSGPAESFIRD